ncbi:acid sphingomyelinase-like phosphodiesterase 3b isoform X2 [Acanthochromis polyacanthus]|uniref:acid sphingomyelinase-like phosphodiesterase 3b isoform X2 n=1 Tax=Acanthochromis polyacanthus TaxID=80966 RepID=UPI0022340253|nr:acid sphingomyelinase-like phosphodiesterase 3b isoform X2 [Acanthochromis polyacanthus]
MSTVGLLLSCLFLKEALALSGNFWHITDLHWDPTYELSNNPEVVCASSGSRPAVGAGQFGDYVCDSPWHLINSSVYAMKNILPDPDFIVWTGDDTPHVPNEDLGEEAVLNIIHNLTNIIQEVFPSGFYTEKLLNQPGFRMLVLNTNLYYDQNMLTQNTADPAGQFSWADQVLTEAANNKEKVYIIGHVPPGFFEKKRSKPWFTPKFNKQYVDLIDRHHSVIAGQFFGHHHTDSFRMFYNTRGSPISTMFLSPGVTPWETTLPGVVNGANNPGIRVFEYDTQTLLVKDVVTYYLNLTHANAATGRWEKEYRLTESFRVPDASPASMHQVLERMANNHCYLQKYYEFNSVNYDMTDCDSDCRVDHVCAAREVDFDRYEDCLVKEGAASIYGGLLPILSVAVSLILTKQ